MKITYENDSEMRIVPRFVTDRSQITNLRQTHKASVENELRNPPSISLILHDFD
jgi:hypothetical protein